MAEEQTCKDGVHKRVIKDHFSIDFKAKRFVPGDCYCLDCKQPIPVRWNGGNLIPLG